MKKETMKTLQILGLLIMIAVFSSVTFAADYAHFHFIGFSNGGKYLAFEEYGINDDVDDSSPYSAIYIVNVDENKFAVLPIKTILDVYPRAEWDEYETKVRSKNRRRAKKQLKRFGIIDGNTGLQVAAHLINEYDTDYDEPISPPPTPTPEEDENANISSPNANSNTSFNQNTAGANANTYPLKQEKVDPMSAYHSGLPQQVSFTKSGNTVWRDGFYQIKIKPVPVTQHCNQYEGEQEVFSFEMTLTNEQHETKTLQKSGKVPKNRGCVDGYGIQEAFLYHNKLAVFVGIFTRGWEGENMRMMAVTGELDK
jgi:predicted secreted protein